jgi:RNA polymerase sigma-70 factor (ECF subfamily)
VSAFWNGTLTQGPDDGLSTRPQAPFGRTVSSQTGPRGDTAVAVGLRPDLEQVFRAEYQHVVAVARRVLGNDNAADDVAQEVFLSFARSTVEASQARGWLLVAAAHTALNLLRAGRRRTDRERAVGADPALPGHLDPGDPATDVVRNLERARVREGLARLPRPQAVALVLRHNGLSYADIADALGMAASGIGTTLRRAEAALREELGNDESLR